MVDSLLLRTSLHFTPLHYTCRNFSSSHLNFIQLHFNNNVKKEMTINECKMSLLSHGQGIVLEKAKHTPLKNLMKCGWISSLHSLRISIERTMLTHLTACMIISKQSNGITLKCPQSSHNNLINYFCILHPEDGWNSGRNIHSFSSLSYDRPKASSKASCPHSAI